MNMCGACTIVVENGDVDIVGVDDAGSVIEIGGTVGDGGRDTDGDGDGNIGWIGFIVNVVGCDGNDGGNDCANVSPVVDDDVGDGGLYSGLT